MDKSLKSAKNRHISEKVIYDAEHRKQNF